MDQTRLWLAVGAGAAAVATGAAMFLALRRYQSRRSGHAATAAAAGAWVAALTDRRGSVWFLGSGSVLTLILLGDEMTGFHSGIGPRLGFPKLMIIAGLLVVTAVWLLGNWRQIRRTRWLTLAVSLVALASSVALDYERRDTSLHVFFEDAPKLLGIVGWATYFVFATADITQSVVRSHEPAATA